MPEILITVADKLPAVTGGVKHIVSDNTDYTARFLLDGEWDGLGPKTVFFADGTSGANYPVVMDGDTCAIPLIHDWHTLLIGVQAGELHTTRPVALPVFPSIARQIGDPVPPTEYDRWTQIMERLLSPMDKTSAMTQPVGKDADGKLWTEPTGGGGGGGGTSFEPGNALELRAGVLNVLTADEAEEDNTLPMTSAGVYMQIGNIAALLETI